MVTVPVGMVETLRARDLVLAVFEELVFYQHCGFVLHQKLLDVKSLEVIDAHRAFQVQGNWILKWGIGDSEGDQSGISRVGEIFLATWLRVGLGIVAAEVVLHVAADQLLLFVLHV